MFPGSKMVSENRKKRYWQPWELITIGTFAALIKISTMLIAIAGGGMNPVSLIGKNVVATALLIVLAYKVRKFGTLTVFVLVSTMVSLLLMGGNMMTIPGMIAAGILCDCLIVLSGGYKKAWALVAGVGLFDLLSRAISLSYSYMLMREELGFFYMGAVIVGIGYFGCILGLPCGIYFVKELRHACIVRE